MEAPEPPAENKLFDEFTGQEFSGQLQWKRTQNRGQSFMSDLLGVNAVIFRPNEETKNKQNKNEDKIEVLLIKRKFSPFNGMWALPGGMLKKEEKFLPAMVREIKKETGLQIKNDKDFIPLSIRQKEGRDPRGLVETHAYILPLSHLEGEELELGDSVSEGRWFLLMEIEELAFDHGAILCEALGMLWKRMPQFQKKLEYLELGHPFKKFEIKDAITFFPGTFNPWHEGHSSCLQLVNYPELIVIPDVNPWKKNNSVLCVWKKYLEICQKLSDTPYSVFPGFIGSENSNPTVDWLPLVDCPEKSIVMGDDNFFQLDSWKDWKKLVSDLSVIYVVSRVSTGPEEERMTRIKNILKNANKKLKVIYLADNKAKNISSSEIRSQKIKGD